jgi:putative nucleotidyltransferase with HDIG domain
MAEVKKISVDVSKIRTAIQAGIPLIITTYTLPHEMELYMTDVLNTFIDELGQSQMKDCLTYCFLELVNNAKKANTKRVYFEDKGLNINDKNEYKRGMLSFKEDTINNIKYYLKKQQQEGLYIKFLLQTRNNKIKLEVRNKSELTVFEYKRIHDRIQRGLGYESVEKGVSTILDSSEGAGLGLVIMVLVLRRIGLTEENFQILSENGETITRMILPFSQKTTQDIFALSKTFVDLIEGLPEFPENIQEINRLINDDSSRMSDIATKISNDVSLTAELLKLVNSAAFSLPSPCHSIPDAVKFAGIRGIRNLLFSIGTMDSLMLKDDSDKKFLWDHSYKVAFYSYNMARNLCKGDKICIDDSYVCGLLHDIGKIVFENAHPSVLKKIEDMCRARGLSKDLFEKLVAGVNHGEVGAMIAEKWNFPEVIINVIRYHHDPLAAPEEFRKITGLVYLADMIVHYGEEQVSYEQMDSDVLALFNLDTEEKVALISERLLKSFREDK